jgi:pimeloyl-ACP methyl ester carboxylesterase
VPEVIASDGVRLYAEAHGEGLPVVFSCAYTTTHENFRPQVEPLVRAGHRAILWDYRGHGRSEAPEDPGAYSMDQVVRDLMAVLDWACPGERAVLGGLSLGGLVSLHCALRHPERARALVLIDSGPGFKNPETRAGWIKQTEHTSSLLEARGMRAFVESRGGTLAVGRRRELPAAQAAAEAIAAQDARAVARFGRRVAGPAESVIEDLPRIHVPTLVVVGEEDEPYQRAAQLMAARIPGAVLEVLPGAGHIGNIEQAQAFDTILLRFLAGLSDGVR